MTTPLDQALLDAHVRDDRGLLITLYQQAAQDAASEQACGFFLTQAFIYALECGDTQAEALRQRLAEMGRESLG